MSLSLSIDGPGDAELISAVRGGDVDAYGELFARHVDAARRLARQLAGPADADDLVSDAFAKVLTVLQRGGGPDLAFRAYLLTAVRRLHVDKIRAGSRLRPVDDLTPFDPGLPFQDTAVEGFENAAAAKAFATLPERWQMVLWHTEVEQQKPADIAPLLGMSANSVSALAYRAREGLRQAFLSQHASDPDDVDCSWTRDHMGAYIRGGLSRRDAKRVDDHLADCRACAAVYLELTEVNSGLAGLLAPLLLGAAGAKYASSFGGGAAAGGAGTTGFAGIQAFAAAHAGLTVIGGLAVTATALVAVYGATHLQGHGAADVGADALPTTSTAGTQSPGDDRPGSTSSRGATDAGSASPSADATSPVTTGTASTSPSDAASTDPALTPPSDSTDPSTPTDPSTGPTDPTTGPVDPGDDPITFTSVPPIEPTFGSTYRVQATSTSGRTVTFSVDATPANACAIDGDVVSFDHAGTCVITGRVTARNAARSGGAGAAAGQTSKVFSQTVDIPRGKQQIDYHGDPTVDGPLLTASGGASGNDVTFASETPDVCSVNDKGTKVAFHHAQTCTVVAHQDGNQDYKPADDTQHFEVAKGDQTVTFTVDGGKVGTTADLQASSSAGLKVTFESANGACTVKGSTVSFVHARDCVVTASAGNADYKDASRERTIAVDKGDQTVTFTPAADGKVGTDAPLEATSSAGLDVRFSSDDAACTVQGDTVTYEHARPCTLTASAGNADWNDATQKQTIEVAKGDQKITFAGVTGGQVGTTADLKASSSAGLDITFTTSDPSCTVTGSTVTYDHAVPCTITAAAGNADWNTASTDQTVDVAKGDQTLDFTPVTDGQVGTSTSLRATSSVGLEVTFATNDASCTVLGSTVSFAHADPCVVTAKQAGNADWNGTSTDQTIEIAKGDQTVDFTPVTGAKVGTGSTLHATTNAGLDVAFSSTSEACAVTGTTVRFAHAGPCVITAAQAGNDDWNAASTDQTVTVGKGTPRLTVSAPDKPAVGGTGTVSAVSDSDGAITFSLGDATTNGACTVSPDGTVAYRHPGTCAVTADQAESADFGAAAATAAFAVGKGDQHLDFTLPATAKVGDSLALTATGGPSGKPVTYNGNAACTVNDAGTSLTIRHTGTCSVTAHQAGNDDYLPAPDVTRTVDVGKGDQHLDFTLPATAKVGDSLALTATGGASGNPVTYSLSADSQKVCSVTGSTLRLDHVGACAVVAHQKGNADYNDAPDAGQTVTVARAAQSIAFTSSPPSPATVGTTYAVTATGGASGNAVTFGSNTSAVCSVSGSTVTFLKAGPCTITANQAGNGDYDAAPQVTQSVTVTAPVRDLTMNITTRPGLLFGIFGTIVDVQVVGLDPGAHATLAMQAHHAIAFSPAGCDANGDNNHAQCDVTSTPTTFSFLALTLQHDANLEFEVRSKDSLDSNPSNNEKTVPLD